MTMNWQSVAAQGYNDLLAHLTRSAAAAASSADIIALALTQLNGSSSSSSSGSSSSSIEAISLPAPATTTTMTPTLTPANVANEAYANLLLGRSGEGGGGYAADDSGGNNMSLSNGAAATLLFILSNLSSSASNNNNNSNSSSNNSSNSSHSHGHGQHSTMRPRISAEIPIWLIPCYSIILLFAVLGNLLVISTLVQNRRMRTITNLFLLNLAISDILLGVLCMPVTLTGTLLRHFIFGEFLCKLIPFLQAISVAVSSWTLVAISCERYYAICHPLRSRRWQTINHAYKIIAFIWLGSVVCMAPIALFSQLIPTSRQGLRKCRENWPSVTYERSYNIFLDFVLLVLPLIILCVAYILITRTLYIGMRNERVVIFANTNTTAPTTTTATTSTRTSSTTFNAGNNICFSNNKIIKTNNVTVVDATATTTTTTATTTTTPTQVGLNFNNSSSHAFSVCALKQQKRQQQQQQQQQQQSKPIIDGSNAIKCQQRRPHCFDEGLQTAGAGAGTGAVHTSGKWKLLKDSNGQRHFYHMRSVSLKSLNSNENGNGGDRRSGSALPANSPTASITLVSTSTSQHQHQQQQQQQLKMKLQTQRAGRRETERRKSNSTPSLRITDAALRRSNEAKNLESKKRVVKMMFVLVLEFFICWSPLYIINTVALYLGLTLYEYVDYTFISFCQLLAYSSSCCNPITYCFMNASFRRSFLDTFKGLQLQSDNLRGKAAIASTSAQANANSTAGAATATATTASLSMAGGNSVNLANSVTVMSGNTTILDSPRL